MNWSAVCTAKKVNPRAGDTSTAIMFGLVLAGAGFGGAGLLYWILGFAFLKVTILFYIALIGLGGRGLSQAIIAAVNSDVNEDLRK